MMLVDDRKTLGVEIKLRRILAGLTQETLGAKVGVDYRQIERWEYGIDPIPAARLAEIGCEVGYDF